MRMDVALLKVKMGLNPDEIGYENTMVAKALIDNHGPASEGLITTIFSKIAWFGTRVQSDALKVETKTKKVSFFLRSFFR